jgi:hypothetical protein
MADQESDPAGVTGADDFASQAEEKQPGILAEFLDFLLHNKKWWLTPIILVLALVGLLVVLSGTAAAPFLYTLW